MTDRLKVDYEHDYADDTQTSGYNHGDEPPCNASPNPTFFEVVQARTSRRGFLVGGLSAAVTGVFGLGLNPSPLQAQVTTASVSTLLGFTPVPISEADTIVVPNGSRVQLLVPLGTPLTSSWDLHGYAVRYYAFRDTLLGRTTCSRDRMRIGSGWSP